MVLSSGPRSEAGPPKGMRARLAGRAPVWLPDGRALDLPLAGAEPFLASKPTVHAPPDGLRTPQSRRRFSVIPLFTSSLLFSLTFNNTRHRKALFQKTSLSSYRCCKCYQSSSKPMQYQRFTFNIREILES